MRPETRLRNRKFDTTSRSLKFFQRLQSELMQLMCDDSLHAAGVSAFPDGENLFRWVGTIQGPEKSPYEGLELKLQIEFPDNYPFKPPITTFKVDLLFHITNIFGSLVETASALKL